MEFRLRSHLEAPRDLADRQASIGTLAGGKKVCQRLLHPRHQPGLWVDASLTAAS